MSCFGEEYRTKLQEQKSAGWPSFNLLVVLQRQEPLRAGVEQRDRFLRACGRCAPIVAVQTSAEETAYGFVVIDNQYGGICSSHEAFLMVSGVENRFGGWPLKVNCGGARFGPAKVFSLLDRDGC